MVVLQNIVLKKLILEQESGIFIQYSRTKKSKYCCHPPFHPPIFCRYSLKLLSPTLPKLMNYILLSPPPLSSDPDKPPKFGTCTYDIVNTYSMKSYCIIYFEHRNDVTRMVKLCLENTSRRRSSVKLDYASDVNSMFKINYTWNKCFIIYQTKSKSN